MDGVSHRKILRMIHGGKSICIFTLMRPPSPPTGPLYSNVSNILLFLKLQLTECNQLSHSSRLDSSPILFGKCPLASHGNVFIKREYLSRTFPSLLLLILIIPTHKCGWNVFQKGNTILFSKIKD